MNIKNIDIDMESLVKLLSQLNERVACAECPFYQQCDGMDSLEDCVEFYLQACLKTSKEGEPQK